MKKPNVYRFEIEIPEGQDEWWEYVDSLKTLAKKREEVKVEIERLLFDRGFSTDYGTKIKVLPNKKKRVYCGE